MRSIRAVFASLAFLLALPLTAVYQVAFGEGGASGVIHLALAAGSALMSLAAFDFKTPRWASWIGALSTGVLGTVFFLQALSEVIQDEALTHFAYQVLGQRLEARLVDLFMVWCVVVLVAGKHLAWRILGVIAMAVVAGVEVYGLVLRDLGTSLDTEAPALKILWLTPFVWLLFEGRAEKKRE